MASIYKFLQEKMDKKGIPLRLSEIVGWAKGSGLPLTHAVLDSVASPLYSRWGKATLYVPGIAMSLDQAFCKAIGGGKVEGVTEAFEAAELRHAVWVMIGMAVNARNWDYSPIRFYGRATSQEAESGFTADFANKHVSGTDDEKSARSTAQERMLPSNQKTVAAYGMIRTGRSGALTKSAAKAFQKEIRSRQTEFTNTYTALTESFAGRAKSLPIGDSFYYLDHVNFRSKNAYDFFEFTEGKFAGTQAAYIDFALSADTTGGRWAVNHLARTATTNVVPGDDRVQAQLGKLKNSTTVDNYTTVGSSTGFRSLL